MVASTAFIAAAAASGALSTVYGSVLLLALLLSWCGDLLLLSGRKRMFLGGLAVFLLAHIAYGAAFVTLGVAKVPLLVALVCALAPLPFVLAWLWPHLGAMRWPVLAYMLAISVMVVLAGGTAGNGAYGLVLSGAVLFYISDIFVARERFVGRSDANRLAGLPAYYAAQLLLAASVEHAR